MPGLEFSLIDPYVMQRVGQFLHQTTHIVEVITEECDDKFLALVKTGGPAAKTAAIMLFTPSWDEVLEEYLDPGKRRGKGRRKRKQKKRRRKSRSGHLRRVGTVARRLFPDVDGLIAKMIPFQQSVSGRRVGKGQYWLFRGIQWADRINFWFLIAEFVDEFTYQWSSGLMEARFCSRTHNTIADVSIIGVFPSYWAWQTNDDTQFGLMRNAVPQDAGVIFVDEVGASQAVDGEAHLGRDVQMKVPPESGEGAELTPTITVTHSDQSQETFFGDKLLLKSPGTYRLTVSADLVDVIDLVVGTLNNDISGSDWGITNGELIALANPHEE